jgi:hypothetical protein
MKANLALRLARLRACSGRTCRRGAGLWVRSRGDQRPRTHGCRTTRARILIGSASARIGDAAFYLDRHLLGRDHRSPFAVFVPRRLAKPAGSRLEAVVTLRDSRRETLVYRIVGCPL